MNFLSTAINMRLAVSSITASPVTFVRVGSRAAQRTAVGDDDVALMRASWASSSTAAIC